MTFTRTSDAYVVHELLRTDDPITPCNPPSDDPDPNASSNHRDWDVLHSSELPGRDILADNQGLWRDIDSEMHSSTPRRTTCFSIHAGPILHRGKDAYVYRNLYHDVKNVSQNHALVTYSMKLHVLGIK